MRLLATLLLLAGMQIALAQTAEARTAACVRLESQLASLDRSGNDASDTTSFAYAIRQQKRQIASVRRQLRSYKCNSSRSRAGHPSCRRLNSTLKLMTDNLRQLERRGGTRTSSTAGRKRQILREMKRQRCDQPDRRQARTERRGVFDVLFGSKRAEYKSRHALRKTSADILDDVFSSPAEAQRRQQARQDRRELALLRKQRNRDIWSTARKLNNHGTYRTVCVRRCDGYYFPVSFSTDAAGLEKDAAACANLCPGTDMELFSHRTSTETAEQMVSVVDGTPYAELKNAFSHREKFDPACACDYSLLERTYNVDVPNSITEAKLSQKFFKPKTVTLPSWPKSRTDDQRPIETDTPQVADIREQSDNPQRRIRVIGNAFFQTQ